MKALIFAAGLGTRLKPHTKTRPKALVLVNNRPMLEWVILRLIKFDIKNIIINVHHFADQIIDFLNSNNNFGINIEISHEKELLDTGGGLKKAAWFFEGEKDLIIHNADILSTIDLKKMYLRHISQRAVATLGIRKRKTNRYLLFDQSMQLCGWLSKKDNKTLWVDEKKTAVSERSFCGIHIVSTRILSELNQSSSFPIIPEYLKLATNKIITGFDTNSYKWLDLGREENLEQATRLFPSEYFNFLQK